MPLKAYQDTKTLIAPLMDEGTWDELRRDVRTGTIALQIPCCGSACFPRVSKLGTRHFAHKRKGPCTTKPETLEHLLIKSEVVLGCRDAGWDAETEVAGDDWRADVLARRKGAEIAFEVQWSKQSLEETEFRQARYADGGVHGVWLFRNFPRELEPGAATPAFWVQMTEDRQPRINLEIFGERTQRMGGESNITISARDFARAYLDGSFTFCQHALSETRVTIPMVFVAYSCWECKAPCHVFFHEPNNLDGLKSRHGWPLATYEEALGMRPEHHPEILGQVETFERSPEGAGLLVGERKNRYSRTMGREYLSQGCPQCDAIFGDWYIFHEPEVFTSPAVARFDAIVHLEKPHSAMAPHWCYDTQKAFCCKD